MLRLSVNLNKIALLRNSRRTGVPDVVRFGRIAHDAGADGLTMHPRPDERHIRRDDVFAIAELMRPWRPGFELNIEGYPDRRLLDLVARIKPEQCTLVPDPPDALTSEEGWKLDAAQHRLVDLALAELKPLGIRVILFLDPDPAAVAPVHNTGADGIEIYTGGYAAAFRAGSPDCAAAGLRRDRGARCGARLGGQYRPRPQPRQSAAFGCRVAGGGRGLDRARAYRRRAGHGLCRCGAGLPCCAEPRHCNLTIIPPNTAQVACRSMI